MTAGTPRAVGIPTATNVHHVGISVPHLEQAISFFTEVIGCEYLFTTGPFADPSGDSMRTNLNAHPRASLMVAMLRCGPTSNLELLEWQVPAGDGQRLPVGTDRGMGHLAFHVADIDAAVAYLRAQPGVTVLGDPIEVEASQPSGGSKFVYFLTPWGLQLELLSAPEPLPYEAATSARLYGPASGWNGETHATPTAPHAR